MKKHVKFPTKIVSLFAVALVMLGMASGLFYSTGNDVVQTPKMAMVSHTEYAYSAPGQIIARLVDFQGAPVAVNNCTATILYPNKVKYVDAALMTASANITGDYYYAFTTPAGPEGTYEYQATCTYGGGSKTASVTNSFHLTPNFNLVLSNLTFIETEIDLVQGNLTDLSTQVSAVNTSLAGKIDGLSAQLNANTTQILNELSAVNGSLYAAIQGLNVTVNLTPVTDAIAALDTAMAGNFTYTNGLITGVNASMVAEFGVVNDKLDVMNVTLNANNAYLVLINATTSDTYSYMTGTLANNVNQVLSDLGVINATVNRIETISTAINATTQTILTNQENAVSMSVFSG